MVTALYRRYRPEAFSEMIGQAQVTEPLMTALRTGRIGHAYLFSGPRGCGKTTSARILARCLNCAEGPTDTPCGVCPSCVELSRDGGGSLDVVEIDAASHGGVDDARDLRERAVFAPARDRYKIFIIDEAHMVTAGGFNALLKIVEEPPPHVKFVFATTEPEKVIGTIRSRTHHYPFRLIAPGALIDYVQGLCESEGIEVEPGVLPLVVRAGGGSARDTLSILDQLIAGSEGGRVTLERAAGLLGFTSTELLDEVVAAFGAHDAAAAFHASDRVVQTGQDPRRFVEDLLERLRDLIVISGTSVQGASAVFRGVPDDQLQRMFEQSQLFGPGELSRVADTVSGALDKMAGATAPRLQLELMIARVLAAGAGAGAGSGAGAGAAAAAGAAASAAPDTAHAVPNVVPSATPPSTSSAPAARSVDPETRPAAAWAEAAAAQAASGQVPSEAAPTGAAATAQATELAASRAESVRPSEPAAAPATNAAEAARSAREFLRTDSAGAASFGRPVTDVLAGVAREPINAEPSAPEVPKSAPQQTQQTQQTQQQQGPQQPRSPEAPRSPETTSLPEAPQASSAAPAGSEQTAPAEQPVQSAQSDEDSHAPGIEDLVDVWPELLEEILQRDRNAWNAVRGVVPMELDGEVLTVGLASESDLAAFKTSGAAALRETILDTLGVNVKYVPKRVAAGTAQAGGNVSQGAARETGEGSGQREQPSSDAEEPHRAGRSTAAANSTAEGDPAGPADALDPLEAKLRERLGAAAFARPTSVEPAQPKPVEAVAKTVAPAPPEMPAPAAEVPEPAADTWQDDEPSDDADGDPWGSEARDPYEQAASVPSVPSVPSAAPSAAPSSMPEAAPSAAPEPSAATVSAAPVNPPPKVGGPSFTRYGEAVVREVLNAKFIEERPLPGANVSHTNEAERA